LNIKNRIQRIFSNISIFLKQKNHRIFENVSRKEFIGLLEGYGIEIGALHNPLPVTENMHVLYVDTLSTAELMIKYPNLSDKIVQVDLILNALRLEAIKEESLDFIIANHLLEHLSNPLSAIEIWHRKLKRGGMLYIALPKCNMTFDKYRQITSWDHILWDYINDPSVEKEKTDIIHIADMLSSMKKDGVLEKKILDKDIHNEAKILYDSNDHGVHYHTWNSQSSFLFFQKVSEMFRSKIIKVADNEHEIIYLLQKK
jgi:predicted SAM-dependent methyltransferase